MYNNDLVGKNKPWGPYITCTKWQKSIYNRYNHMVHRCEDPNCSDYKTYGGVGIKCRFTSLSHYYHTLEHDPLWDKFKANPELYHVDKDIKCGHGSDYTPHTISIQTGRDNDREVAIRTGLGNAPRSISVDGVVYPSVKEAQLATGLSKASIELHGDCKTTSAGYTYKHTWVDRSGVPHEAHYI